jgi:hypothetical protein
MSFEHVLAAYRKLQKQFPQDQKNSKITDLLERIVLDSLDIIVRFDKRTLTTGLLGKNYFSFSSQGKISRAVNRELFIHDPKEINRFFAAIRKTEFTALDSTFLTRACYSSAVAFCCLTDIFKTRDQKTPATYFEYLIGHIIAAVLECNPTKQLDVLSGDLSAKLPTDFIFDLGEKRTKFHIPVKTSTRERVIQVWAHQRVLDGVYGTGRYKGILVCLSETKLDHETLDVVEICLPDQWRIYQMFIAHLERVYYLDVPVRYGQMISEYPRIEVRQFGDFFLEYKTLSR